MDLLKDVLATRPELLVAPVVVAIMLVVTRFWGNPTQDEATKLKQSLTAGLLALAGAIGAQASGEGGWESVQWLGALGTGALAWWISMGGHVSLKRGSGAIRVLKGEDH